MWTARSEELPNVRALHFTLDRDARPVTYADILAAGLDDASFRFTF